jgi:hypothetical protein
MGKNCRDTDRCSKANDLKEISMDFDDFKLEKRRTNRKVAKVLLVWLVIIGGLTGYGI